MDVNRLELIMDSFFVVRPRIDEMAELFYALLFDCAPNLRAAFPAEIGPQAKKLSSTLSFAIGALSDPAGLTKVLHDLGKDHAQYQISAHDYALVNEVMLLALAHICADEWTPDLHTAWSETLDFIADTMQEGERRVHVA